VDIRKLKCGHGRFGRLTRRRAGKKNGSAYACERSHHIATLLKGLKAVTQRDEPLFHAFLDFHRPILLSCFHFQFSVGFGST
jgi:hypothetical protein